MYNDRITLTPQEILDKGMGEIPTDTSALVPSSMYMQSSKQLSH